MWVAHAPGMPGTFSLATDSNGKRQLAIPACIRARASRTCRDACRDCLSPVAGKTFPAFPGACAPAIFRILQESHMIACCHYHTEIKTKWPPVSSQMKFIFFNKFVFIKISLFQLIKHASVGSDNGLVLNKRQAITWTNGDHDNWRLHAGQQWVKIINQVNRWGPFQSWHSHFQCRALYIWLKGCVVYIQVIAYTMTLLVCCWHTYFGEVR